MNMNWLSMIGGGITAAATLAVGISTSGILAANPTSEDTVAAAGETIYVEQPVIEVSATRAPIETFSVDPIVIAILPAPTESDPTLAPAPSMPASSYEDGEDYVGGEDGEDGEYEDEYDDEGDDEGADHGEGADDGDDD